MAGTPVLLEIHQVESGHAVVFRLVGVLDISTVGILRGTVSPHLRRHAEAVVDLSDVTFCDSTGLGAIVALHREAGRAGSSFALRSPRPRVAAVLAMTGVDQVVTIVDSPADPAG